MEKNDLLRKNPLRWLGYETDDILPEGGFGAVLARAGVGKTALLVQLALNTLLRNKNVLHISLNDLVQKVTLWYEEIFHNLINNEKTMEVDQLWQSLLPNRFIMNFKVEGFSVPKLEERLTDLISQDIFSPDTVIIDGFLFDESADKSLSQLKSLAQEYKMHVWFAVRIHRHEKPAPDGMPVHLSKVADLFNVVLQLHPEGKEIFVKLLKGEPETSHRSELLLDPSTMLLKDG